MGLINISRVSSTSSVPTPPTGIDTLFNFGGNWYIKDYLGNYSPQGLNGSSGVSGTSGSSGTNGSAGTSGTNGSAGTSGTNGSAGTSGSSGSSGVSDYLYYSPTTGTFSIGSSGTGSVVLTNPNLAWSIVQTAIIYADMNNYMYVRCEAYNSATGVFLFTKLRSVGSGTYVNGAINLTGEVDAPTLQNTLENGNNSGTYSIELLLYKQHTPIVSTLSGSAVQDLKTNTYIYTLNGNTTWNYENATYSVYNFMINAGTWSFTLNSGGNFKTVGATGLGFTGSFIMSGVYDGTDMWISTVKNYQSY